MIDSPDTLIVRGAMLGSDDEIEFEDVPSLNNRPVEGNSRGTLPLRSPRRGARLGNETRLASDHLDALSREGQIARGNFEECNVIQ